MAKKKAGGKKKASKGAKPKWMPDDIFALTQDLARLVEHFSGVAAAPIIDADLVRRTLCDRKTLCVQAGMYLWRMLYPGDKKTSERREEATKLGLIEAAVKCLSAENRCPTPAVGVLGTLVDTAAGRDTFFAVKGSSPVGILLGCLERGNVCLAAYTCRVLAKLAGALDSKLRVMKGMQGWKWDPLVEVLRCRKVTSHLGGDYGIADAAAVITSLCCTESIPENTAPNSYKQLCSDINEAVLKAGAVEILTEILRDRVPNWCKVSVVKALRTLFKGSEGRKAKQIFVHHRGRTNALELLKNVFFTLPIRASIVECLCVSLLPDATQSDAEFCDWSTSQIHSEEPVEGDENFEIIEESEMVPLLLNLCLGPDGPLPEIADFTDTETLKSSSKLKKQKSKKKKKAPKLEPGMADAQTYATGCLRILCIHDAVQQGIMRQGGIRFLAPLLSSKVQQTRWNARQVLLTLAGVPDYANEMTRYKLPPYITRSNIPNSKFFETIPY